MVSNQDLQEFWDKLNTIKYLVMRNFTDLLEDINSGGDIDLLVENAEEFIKCIDAVPLNNREKCFNYKVEIGSEWIPVDIRVAGDGYYDSRWENDMLSKRIMYKDGFYVMNDEDYFFSIAYHSIIHKPEIPAKYRSMFEQRDLSKDSEIIKSLNGFMSEHGYDYVVPVDRGVTFNKKNMRKMIFRKNVLSRFFK